MSSIKVFDLDDTLYSEITFVKSGFLAVADMLNSLFGVPQDRSYYYMMQILHMKGRGKVFDLTLIKYGLFSKKNVNLCINTYRHHIPNINLFDCVQDIFDNFDTKPYIVTDGNKMVQASKIKNLGLEDMISKAFLTHRYGIKNAKPSLYCFNLIKELEGCRWKDIIYIGDNPNKDFVELNKVGAQTVQVNFGPYANQSVPMGFNAKYRIESLIELNNLTEIL